MANMDMNVDTYAVERGVNAVKSSMANVQTAAEWLWQRVGVAGERFNDPNYVYMRDAVLAMRDSLKHVCANAAHIETVARRLCDRVEAYNDTTYKE